MISYPENVDIKLISAVGENIPAAVRGQTTILEHMLPDNMLDDFYKKGLGFARYNAFMASMMKQMTHRYPHAKILEIGKKSSRRCHVAWLAGFADRVFRCWNRWSHQIDPGKHWEHHVLLYLHRRIRGLFQ